MEAVGLLPVQPPAVPGLPAQPEPGLEDPEKRRLPQKKKRSEGFEESETSWRQLNAETVGGS